MKFLILAGAAILCGASLATAAAPSATRAHEFLTAPAQRQAAAFVLDQPAIGLLPLAGQPAALPPQSPLKPVPVVAPAATAPGQPVLDPCSGGGRPPRGCPPG